MRPSSVARQSAAELWPHAARALRAHPPFLFGLDPERAHDLTLAALARAAEHAGAVRCGAAARRRPGDGGRACASPTASGLAAGLDKNGALHRRPGRDGLRLHRGRHRDAAGRSRATPSRACSACREAQALINRLGFNNDGLDAFVANVQRATTLPRRRRHPRPEHRQERRHADRARGRRLPRRPGRRVPARRLRGGQHLRARTRRTCARCRATRRWTRCCGCAAGARRNWPRAHGQHGADLREDRARPRRGAGRRRSPPR
ncbi:MAG: hypothetical protein MZW92_70665 [Comamonadaceae bacterium]|nr:hypothetical protein [Comamonadaceae bacterium]